MKITVLAENTSCCEALCAEHGLSLFIETNGHRVLFDMGQTDAFARNAERLGIDLGTVDIAVLSHGHYDHGGGIRAFLALNERAPVYVSALAFGDHYNASNKYIGLDPSLAGDPRLIPVGERLELDPSLTLLSCNELERHVPTDPFGLQIRLGGQLRPDSFLHEQYLLIREGERRILISGCSHKGILNIAKWFAPDVLVGGFHLSKLNDADRLHRVADALLQYPTVYYTGHCTGAEQLQILKNKMGNRLFGLSTGENFEI